ncbi:MAG: hypothetical protein WCL50_12790, partial [Spirochaetota bacterium]
MRAKAALPFLAATFGLLLGSCAAEEVRSFVWQDLDGRPLGFVQDSAFPEGAEGHFGAGRAVNSFRLTRTLELASDSTIEITIARSSASIPRLSFEILGGKKSDPPLAGEEIALSDSRTSVCLSAAGGWSLRGLRIALRAPADGQSGDDANAAGFAIEGIRVTRIFRGLDRS